MTQVLLRREPVSLVEELFQDFISRGGTPLGRSAELPSTVRARMDVIDAGKRFDILIDLPGVNKNDISVTVEGARVSIAAQTKNGAELKDGERLLHSERFAASYARTFELPAEVTDQGAQANFENGVLRLGLPKRAAFESKRLVIT